MATNLTDVTEMIRKMPAGDIYLMADRRWVEMGFGLASKSSAVNIIWDGINRLLRMTVERFLVVVHCKDGRIKSACSCAAWSPKRDCPHAICAIITLKKAVSPATFPTISFSERYIKYLSESLELDRKDHKPENELRVEKPSAMKDIVCLVIERSDDRLDINIKKNGITLYAYNNEMPVELRDLWMRSYGNFSGGKELIIEEFCRRFRDRYPVFFKDGAKEVPLSFDFESQHNLRIGMDASSGVITLSLLPDAFDKADEGMYITRVHLFDLTRGTIGRVTESPAWDTWKETSELVSDLYDTGIISVKRDRHRITLSTDDFNKLQIEIYENEKKTFLQYCRLTIAGKESEVSTAKSPSYNLHAKENENDQVKVVARGIIDKTEFYLSPKPFMLFTTNIIGRLSAPLRAKKRL